MGVEDHKYAVYKERANLSPRRDLLRSYGSAVMVIGERTYKKIEDQDGTIGWLARKLAFIAFPIFWLVRFLWLSNLSFIDRRIQTVEWVACKIFPRSEVIFSKIDGLARVADSLPDKLDNVIDAVGGFVGGLPVLSAFYWVVEVVEEIFKIMMSFIPYSGSGYAEKSMNVDVRSTYRSDEDPKKNVNERSIEGGGILENTDAIESEGTKDDIFFEAKDDIIVSEGKPDRVKGENMKKADAADNKKNKDDSNVSEGKSDRVEAKISGRTDAASNEKTKDNSTVLEGESDSSKSKGENRKGRKKKGKIM